MNYLVFESIAATPKKYENRAEEKILRYSKHIAGWFYGQGIPPSDTVVKHAIELLHTAQAYSFFVDSTLGVEGEIQLVVYHERDRLQFTITGNNGIEFLHERKRGLPYTLLPDEADEEICYEESIMFDDAITKINHFGRVIWSNISGLSNQNIYTIIHTKENSATLPLRIRQTKQESRVYQLVA
jgi:hypothetical protein